MTGEWRETTLDQLGRIITGKTPPSSHPEYFGSDIPFVTPTDFDGRRLIKNTGRYLTEGGANFLIGCHIPPGAVMVSCIGSDMGKAAVACRDCVTNQQINSIVIDSGDDPLFVYYNLSVRKEEIRSAASGSAQPILNKSAFGRLGILLPPPTEQRAIAHILGTLDDKIELNRRMNETLEAMARALFQLWFVDFDPVRAKTEGRDPGLPKEIADLFPDRLVDSELGEIPAGWGVRPLGEVADVNWGDTSTTKVSYVDHGYTAYSASGPDELLPYYDFDRTGVVLSAIGANAGVMRIALAKWSCIKNTIRFWATDSNVCTEYLYHATSGRDMWTLRGSAQPFISQGDARAVRLIIPMNGLARTFGEITGKHYQKIKSHDDQSRTLAALRDTLLPKLISGQLRVKDAERYVQETSA
jgi:type I restriction enzyme S subunit